MGSGNGRKAKHIPTTWEIHTRTRAGKRYTYLGWIRAYHEAEKRQYTTGGPDWLRDLERAYPEYMKRAYDEHKIHHWQEPQTHKSRISIRPYTYNKRPGYLLTGRDAYNRKISIFAETRQQAERMRKEIKQGKEPRFYPR